LKPDTYPEEHTWPFLHHIDHWAETSTTVLFVYADRAPGNWKVGRNIGFSHKRFQTATCFPLIYSSGLSLAIGIASGCFQGASRRKLIPSLDFLFLVYSGLGIQSTKLFRILIRKKKKDTGSAYLHINPRYSAQTRHVSCMDIAYYAFLSSFGGSNCIPESTWRKLLDKQVPDDWNVLLSCFLYS
jgi:hypothetical protein